MPLLEEAGVVYSVNFFPIEIRHSFRANITYIDICTTPRILTAHFLTFSPLKIIRLQLVAHIPQLSRMTCSFQGINHPWAESTCVILRMLRRILTVWFVIGYMFRAPGWLSGGLARIPLSFLAGRELCSSAASQNS